MTDFLPTRDALAATWFTSAVEAAARQLLSDRTNGLCELDKVCAECDCSAWDDTDPAATWAYDRIHAANAIKAALPAIREGLAAEFAASFEVGVGEACELLGITYRQIDHGVVTGVFPCTVPADGSGSVRWFSVADLLTIRGVLERRRIAEELWPGKRRVG